MTFRKKDPELVNLHILGDDGEIKIRKYRVTKYQDFITTLQVKRFFLLSLCIFDFVITLLYLRDLLETYGAI